MFLFDPAQWLKGRSHWSPEIILPDSPIFGFGAGLSGGVLKREVRLEFEYKILDFNPGEFHGTAVRLVMWTVGLAWVMGRGISGDTYFFR